MRRTLLLALLVVALPAHADVPPENDPTRYVSLCHRVDTPEIGSLVLITTADWDRGGRPRNWTRVVADDCLHVTHSGPTRLAAVDRAAWEAKAGAEQWVDFPADGVAFDLDSGFEVPRASPLHRRHVVYSVASSDDRQVVLYKHRIIDELLDGKQQTVEELAKP